MFVVEKLAKVRIFELSIFSKLHYVFLLFFLGVDFPDVCARGVIITGLPYPNKFEPRIRVKMEYLDQSFRNPTTKTLSSNEWYNREAWSAVNQALGRTIRHANDFGACILTDCRFEQDSSRKQLSGWLRNAVRNYSFPVSKRALSDFFRERTDRKPTVSILRDSSCEEVNSKSKLIKFYN